LPGLLPEAQETQVLIRVTPHIIEKYEEVTLRITYLNRVTFDTNIISSLS
jgi:hypothetical protein